MLLLIKRKTLPSNQSKMHVHVQDEIDDWKLEIEQEKKDSHLETQKQHLAKMEEKTKLARQKFNKHMFGHGSEENET